MKKVYQQLIKAKVNSSERPNPELSLIIWSEIWDNEISHNKTTEQLTEVKTKDKLQNKMICYQCLNYQSKKKNILNWNCSGLYSVLGYCLKTLTVLHGRVATQLDGMINNVVDSNQPATTSTDMQ